MVKKKIEMLLLQILQSWKSVVLFLNQISFISVKFLYVFIYRVQEIFNKNTENWSAFCVRCGLIIKDQLQKNKFVVSLFVEGGSSNNHIPGGGGTCIVLILVPDLFR